MNRDIQLAKVQWYCVAVAEILESLLLVLAITISDLMLPTHYASNILIVLLKTEFILTGTTIVNSES